MSRVNSFLLQFIDKILTKIFSMIIYSKYDESINRTHHIKKIHEISEAFSYNTITL